MKNFFGRMLERMFALQWRIPCFPMCRLNSTGMYSPRNIDSLKATKTPKGFSGILIEFDIAPYQFLSYNNLLFYVVIIGRDGLRHIFWGHELKTALIKSSAKVGNLIVLRQTGKKSMAPTFGGGNSTWKAKRNLWVITLESSLKKRLFYHFCLLRVRMIRQPSSFYH
ncbi:hypothetical protein ICN48_07250 [Polynucleobacter sp. JS-Safj-400b-B2]|uniref:hypothetical protein n=1 Tax=Polynucleobacter sp. JS-Safj-400b-B2 TaxID=2576921 RepID=UPI001C0D49A1|nr:hypothetical protein [Polynucleobacter sp. JS-Safj-400b-B2]MBU3626028.1 hypothetical protein [Polynucleobacter sp. JS-Safj-400b-B2]